MSSSRSICIVCGSSDTDPAVRSMHYFPANVERSRVWQEEMGMKFSGDSRRNSRICSRHFTPECYLGKRLSKNAIPTLLSCRIQPSVSDAGDLLTLNLEIEGGGITDPQQAGPSSSTITTYKVKGRLFKNIPNLSRDASTPRKRHLMNVILKKEDQVRKLKRLCKVRSNDIKALSDLTDTTVVRKLFSGMSQTTADFLASQLRCARQHPKGRRWTMDEKIIALSIFKRSPKCYSFMRRIVALPTRRTLLDLLSKVPFKTGINDHLFVHLKETLTSKSDKLCVLLFDEMDIKEHYYYDAGHDKLVGFEDYGRSGEVKTKPANKALVFMLQGIGRNWKQPVAYYFCNNACTAAVFVQCLKEVVETALTIAEVNIVGTVCDMGTNNVKALKDLGSTLERPYIVLNGRRLYTMFDPPHLLKCTAALFRKYNVYLPVPVGGADTTMEAKFSTIRAAYDRDVASPFHFRALFRLTSTHMAPVMRFAMKVNIAAQVMSRSVASYLYTSVTNGDLDPSTVATATFVSQVDTLFDSFNGTQLYPGDKPLKCAISEESEHLRYWKKATAEIKQWQYRRITKRGTLKEGKPPSHLGWMVSIRAIQAIWSVVQREGLTHLKPRHLNQDALENLFGCVRGGCGSGDNPTTFQFIGSIKTQILNGLTKSGKVATNCEDDEHELLCNLKRFLSVAVHKQSTSTVPGVMSLPDDWEEPADESPQISDSDLLSNTGIFSVAYVSGFLLKRIFNKVTCASCKMLLCDDATAYHNLFIANREWTDEGGKLFYPSEQSTLFVGRAITLLEQFVPTYGGGDGIAKAAANFIASKVDTSWITCDLHKETVEKMFLEGVCRVGLPWWAKRHTRDLAQTKKDAKAARETKRKLRTMQHQ